MTKIEERDHDLLKFFLTKEHVKEESKVNPAACHGFRQSKEHGISCKFGDPKFDFHCH